jgi:hypothetical protein
MVVEILVTEGCPNEDAAIGLVGMAASALEMTPRVILVEVTDLAEAQQHNLAGSPTIRIDGYDVAPSLGEDVTLSCRTYATTHGHSGIPDVELVIAALERAAGRGQ